MKRCLRFVLSIVCISQLVPEVAGSEAEVKYWTAGLVADNHFDTFPAGEKAPWEPMPHWLKGQQERTTWKKRRYDIARDKMDEAIDVFNRADQMSMVVNLGDIVNNDLMWNLKPILDSFNKAKAPKFNLLGNHDLRAHNDRFGKDNITQHQWAKTKLAIGAATPDKWYFRVDHPPFVFLFFDSMVMEGAQRNRKLKEEHVTWAIEQCDDAKSKGYAVVIYAHISIGIETNPMGKVLKHYPHIVAAFFGHEHKGGYIVQRGIHCVILQGQIETMVNAFAVVEAFQNRLEVSGFGRVPSYTLKFKPETVQMLKKYSGPMKTDIFSQGNQPLPPEELWANEVLQKPPPLNLHLPGYRKPMLPATEPNGKTRFILEEYAQWPHRILTPTPEELSDLMDYDENQRIARLKRDGKWTEKDAVKSTTTTTPLPPQPPSFKALSTLAKATEAAEDEDHTAAPGKGKVANEDTKNNYLTPLPPHRYATDQVASSQSSMLLLMALPVMLTLFVIYRYVLKRKGLAVLGSATPKPASAARSAL